MSDRPNTTNLAGKIQVFRRRKAYLEKKIEQQTRSEGELCWDMAEVSALKTAIAVCEWYANDRDGNGNGPLDLLQRVASLEVNDVSEFLELQRDIRDCLEEIEDD
jgi:hypothetical protein